jgi:hypothetical protein
MNYKKLIFESNRRRDVIRTLVRDIIKIYKEEDDGEFYLPNYLNDTIDFYNFTSFDNDLVLDLTIQPNNNLDTFKVNGEYFRNDHIIDVTIEYNPEVKSQITYDLVGELNEVLAHEIRHVDQKTKGIFNLDVPEEEDPYKYYTQEHELDAQVFGFKRLSRLTKTPFDVVVKKWFKTHKDIHRLNDQQTDDVITKILNYKR